MFSLKNNLPFDRAVAPMWYKVFVVLFSLGGVLMFGLSILFVTRPTHASGPSSNQVLNYQARLTDNNGIPLPDGAKNVKFVIYDALSGGNCEYSVRGTCGTPTAKSVTVANGHFSTLLGEAGDVAIPAGLFSGDESRFLEIQVETSTPGTYETLSPRKRIVSGPFAMNANLLDDLDTSAIGGSAAFVPVTDASGNFTLTKNVTFDANSFFVDATNHRIGIGTTSPTTLLDLNGALTAREMSAPAVSPADQGRIYFDATTNKFRVSENGGAYADLVGGGTLTGSGTSGQLTFWNGTSSVAGSSRLTVNDATAPRYLSLTGDGTVTVAGGALGLQVQNTAAGSARNAILWLQTTSRNWAVGAINDDGSFRINDDSAGSATRLKIDTSGRMYWPNGVWHRSLDESGDNADRFFFASSSHTYFQSPAQFNWRDTTGTDRMNFDPDSTPRLTIQNGSGIMFNTTNNVDQDFVIDISASGAGDKRAFLSPTTTTNLALGVGLSEKMRILNSGNVGIGTAVPSDILHLYKSQNTSTYLTVQNPNAGNSAYSFLYAASDAANGLFGTASAASANTALADAAFAIAESNASGGLVLSTRAAAPIKFYTNSESNERMRIDSAGNVGVGTTVPLARVHISGTDAGFQLIDWYSASSGGAGYIGRAARGSQASPTQALSGDNLTYLAGRGYTSSSAFSGNQGLIIIRAAENFTASAQGTYITFQTTPTGSTTVADRMLITAAGNVGVGTTAPNTLLDLNGNLATRATSPAQITADQNDYNPGAFTFIRLSSDASRNITGLAGGVDGYIRTFRNVGSSNIVFQHQNVGSAAANRLILGAGSDFTLAADQSVSFIYDATTQRWQQYAGASTAGAGTVTGTGTATRVAFWNGASSLSSNANLYWDDTNSRLGIGTTTPGHKLEVAGGLMVSGTTATSGTGAFMSFDGTNVTFFPYNYGAGTSGTNFIRGGTISLDTYITGTPNTRLFIENDGDLGIGTSSPNSILNVVKTSAGAETTGLSLSNKSDAADTAIGINFQPHSTGTTLAKILAVRTATSNGPTDLRFFTYNDGISPTGLNERMRIDASGNVGIGTTSPGSRLSVVGVSGQIGLGVMGFAQTFGERRGVISVNDSTTSAIGTGPGLVFGAPDTSGAQGELGSIQAVRENNTTTNWDGALQLLTRLSSRTPQMQQALRIDSSGRVLIGTGSTFSGTKFDVRTVATTGGWDGMRIINPNGRSYALASADSTGNPGSAGGVPGNGFAIIDSTSTATRLSIDSSGNVGIGTTSPGDLLDVYGSTNGVLGLRGRNINAGASTYSTLYLGNATSASDVVIFNVGTGNSAYGGARSGGVGTNSSTPFVFITASTERMRINSSGNVGIGNTNPQALLDLGTTTLGYAANGVDLVAGRRINLYGSNNDHVIGMGSGGMFFTGNTDIRFDYKSSTSASNGTTRMFLNMATGNVGIGTTTANGRLVVRSSGGNHLDGLWLQSENTNDTWSIFETGGHDLNFGYATAASGADANGDFATKFQFTDDGNLGIGLSAAPTVPLQVTGTGTYVLATNSPSVALASGNAQISISSSSAMAADLGGSLLFAGYSDGSSQVPFGYIAGRKENGTSGNEAGYLQFGTRTTGAATERMRISSVGQVGIGVTPSVGALQVSGTDGGSNVRGVVIDRYSGGATGTSPGFALLRGARGTQGTPTQSLSGDDLGAVFATGYTASSAFASEFPGAILFRAAENITTSAMGGHIDFQTIPIGSTTRQDRMRITSAGFVGINDSTPDAMFDVEDTTTSDGFGGIISSSGTGTASVSPAALGVFNTITSSAGVSNGDTKYGIYVSSTGSYTPSSGSTNNYTLYVQNATGATNNYAGYFGGAVGVGQGAPQTSLHVTIGNGTMPTLSTGDVAVLQNNSSTSDAARLVLIGGNAGYSTIFFGDTDYNRKGQIYYEHSTEKMHFVTNDTVRALFDSTGLLPGATNTYNLGASGSNWGCLYYNNSTLGTCASDERLKRNISDLDFGNALEQVAQLRLRTYSYTSDAANSLYDGLIAQEVEVFAPELVVTNPDGYKSIKYGDIQWITIQALQQLNSKVDQLAASETLSASSLQALAADLNVNGKLLLNVRGVIGLAWSISEDGMLVVKEIEADKVTAKEMVMKQTDEVKTIGQAVVPAGATSVIVTNPSVKAGMEVFITFRKNPAGGYWVDAVSDGSFTVMTENPVSADAPFSYWLIGIDDATTPVVAPVVEPPVVVAPPTEPAASPEPASEPPVEQAASPEPSPDQPINEETNDLITP